MGLSIVTLIPGDGKTYPKPGDTVSIHYIGTLTDGSKFDSSHDRGHPFRVKIGQGVVIAGWDEGVPKMSLGEKALLTAPPEFVGLFNLLSLSVSCVNQAYGPAGVPPIIPPNATLKFEMELLKIEPA
ncbi:peptidyl-prolyl cis-trans isomerase [Armillaria gallica]|uniref:peptidylprolyl isomerase n=1 Tax=Armillaria gallica TaxID=47427 RepID=A0A2H3DU74_ARMGA|nr:peptidyl-prolyl cis-trans isomerase [Armillaria gallica]